MESAKKKQKRSVNDALADTSSKPAEQRQHWIPRYEWELGLASTGPGKTGEVTRAACKFCICFGREDEQHTKSPASNASRASFADLLVFNKRKKTTRIKYFTSFRKDNIVRHHVAQHSKMWEQYKLLPMDESERAAFFAATPASKITVFMSDRPSFVFSVPASVMDEIARHFYPTAADHAGTSVTVALADTLSVAPAFDGFVELGDGCYQLAINNRDQFETVVKCVNINSSFRSVVESFIIFCEATNNSRLGRPNQHQVARYVRYLVAINLTAIRAIIDRVWGFSIMVDGATHASKGYLDMRISFALNGTLHNIHFLAFPTSNRAHTAAAYAGLVLGGLQNVIGADALFKLIGIATDGAATMLGCRQGFAKRIVDACENVGGSDITVNWCGSHQLNLAVDEWMSVFDEFVDFRSTLGYEVSFSRTHDTVAMSLGKCPTYATTRWTSIDKSCQYLARYYEDLLPFQSDKNRTPSSASWWLCLFVVADLTSSYTMYFSRLQHENITTDEQYNALQELKHSLQIKFEGNQPDGDPTVDEVKTIQQICGASAYSCQLFESLTIIEQDQLVASTVDAVQVAIDGLGRILIEVRGGGDAQKILSPLQVIECDDKLFKDTLIKYRPRLRELYGKTVISEIWNQRKQMQELSARNSAFRHLVDHASRGKLDKAWEEVDKRKEFSCLRDFVLGLGSISPGTHSVEGEFSNLKRIKNEYRSNLLDYSLEGQLHARQYFKLVALASATEE